MKEHELRKNVNREKRARIREASEEAELGEHRRGSNLRRQYTCKQKKRILEVFDEINSD